MGYMDQADPAGTICYHADQSFVAEDGQFEVIAIRHDQPGYIVLDTHPGLTAAVQHAAVLNEDRGVDHPTKLDIMATALAASHQPRAS